VLVSAIRLITAALTAKSFPSLHLSPLQTDPLLTGHYCQHHQAHDTGSSSSGTYKYCASVCRASRPGDQRVQRVRKQSFTFTRHPPDPPVCRCPASNGDGDGVRCGLALQDALHHPHASLNFSPYAHSYPHCGCAGVTVQGTTQESFLKSMMRISETPYLKSQALDLRGTEAARFGALVHEVCCRFPSKPSLKLNVWHSV
jgi:hypothetical protein